MYPFVKKRDGNVCVSCGKGGLAGKGWHAGHFVKAEICNMKYRYDPRNIHSQCGRCNNWLDGNFIAYEKAMIKKYGQKVVDELKDKHKEPLPLDFNAREFLEDSIDYYKKLVEAS